MHKSWKKKTEAKIFDYQWIEQYHKEYHCRSNPEWLEFYFDEVD